MRPDGIEMWHAWIEARLLTDALGRQSPTDRCRASNSTATGPPAAAEAVARKLTRVYRVVLEHFIGEQPGSIDDLLQNDVFVRRRPSRCIMPNSPSAPATHRRGHATRLPPEPNLGAGPPTRSVVRAGSPTRQARRGRPSPHLLARR